MAERKARKEQDRLNPWRPMRDARPDGTICDLLFNDMVGSYDAEGIHYHFLDASGTWFYFDPPHQVRSPIMNWRLAWVRMTPERRKLIKTKAERRFR